MSRFSKYNISAKYKSGFVVLCKCPYCGTRHFVEHETRPIVMPRIFCEDCKFHRYDSNEGSGYVKTKKAGRRAAA
jgi:transposase-like protein